MKRITLQKQGHFACSATESLLEAAQRQGYTLPKACRNGVCHICEATLSSGRVRQKDQIIEAHSRSHAHVINRTSSATGELAENANTSREAKILVCCAYPQTDLVVQMDKAYARGKAPMSKVVCEIAQIDLIAPCVHRIKLRLPAGKPPVFYAGQYLAMSIPGRPDPCYYSIASAPGTRDLELHIQAMPDSESALAVIDHLQRQRSVEVSLPYGKACLPEVPSVPVVMLAAGTGFAQMKSIAEFVLGHNPEAHVHLFWGVRRAEEMYMADLPKAWAKHYPNLKFVPLIADSSASDSADHHTHLCQALIDAEPDIERDLVFVSGSPRLVFAALDLLKKAGLPETQFFSDVLEYASP